MRPASDRLALLGVLGMLALGSVPDAMVYPALRGLTVDRHGISEHHAAWFALVPTLGAILSAFFLPRLVRSFSPLTVLRIASIIEAMLLAAVALSIPYWAVIVIRLLSGACDLAGIAATLRIAMRVTGESHRARAMGWMGTAIMLGLLGGLGVGALVPRSMILLLAALPLVLLAVVSYPLEWSAPRVHDPDPPRTVGERDPVPPRERIIAACLVASDRALSAVLSVAMPLAVPLLVASDAGDDGTGDQRRLVGTILGLSMLGMVFGGPIGGELVDRIGAARVRFIGAMVFGLGVVAIVFVSPLGSGAMILAAAVAGVGAAPLFPSALAIGTRDRSPTGVHGAIQAAGQGGYALGSASVLLAPPGSIRPEEILTVCAMLYLALNVASAWLLRAR